ncbi:MAG TPA: ribbon-helix-helix domain-containing protein [Micromonosporaceae bacterium]|nr:ribbon-helix-helix domain-containing protein [Micromonosporaceae bacterium]
MNGPDFEQMTKDEVVAWFRSTNDLSPVLASMVPATEPVGRPPVEVPMLLASIRLPVALVEQLDSLAKLQGVRRSDVIRDALAAYVAERTSPVGRDEAEHALDVIRRIVVSRDRAA